MKVSIIVAIDKNRGIGKDNKLLWHIPEDLKRFRQLTSGHTIIMGRKTFESIGRVLPNRTNIIITRDKQKAIKGAIVVNSLEEAIEKASSCHPEHSPCHPELVSGSRSRNKFRFNRNKFGMTRREVRHDNEKNECFIIGGGQIFAQALPLADKLYLTIVDGEYNADTFFPDYSEFKKVVFEQEGQSGEYKYKFLDLEK